LTQQEHRTNRGVAARIAGFGVAAALVALAAGAAGWELGHSQAPQRAALPVLFDAPHYADLINQNGARVSSARFDGKVPVVTFLFPYCNTFCPVVATHLVGFENMLAGTPLAGRVDIVAFDVDPAGTGPRQMRGFLHEYGWNPDNPNWQYLTGTSAQIRRVVTQGFHVDYQKVVDSASGGDSPSAALAVAGSDPQAIVANPLADQAHVDYDITHEDVMMLVDPRGRVRRIYDQADAVGKMRLLADVRAVLGAAG
jgi:cytochrome oxidase Cu insertion factor (SCO1/SenC/PrrC family)